MLNPTIHNEFWYVQKNTCRNWFIYLTICGNLYDESMPIPG